MLYDVASRGRSRAPYRTVQQSLVICMVVAGLGWFYYVAAVRHAETVNWFKARGDQSAYLAEAKLIYANVTGRNAPPVIQPRNRMPLYPAFLALFYDPAWSDDEFFVQAKHQSILLSLALLVVLTGVAVSLLPPLLAANFVLVVAFGYFVFKAGYTQSELLYYTLHFAAFVAMWQWLTHRSLGATLGYGVEVGLLSALAHLTKAAILPLLALCLLVFMGRELVVVVRTRQFSQAVARLFAATAMVAVFVGVLAPYLATSKRVHGQYFYNLNTAVLIWYDNWPQASVAISDYGPDGWPKGGKRARPGPLRYWREHSISQIAGRFAGGFRDMVSRSYHTFWYFKFVMMYVLMAAMVVATMRRTVWNLARTHVALAIFCVLYAAIYLPATAFYEPTSGTGTTRFLLAHVAPLLFALSVLLGTSAVQRRTWMLAGLQLTVRHFTWLVLITVGFDVSFTIWPRLMTTYGGF